MADRVQDEATIVMAAFDLGMYREANRQLQAENERLRVALLKIEEYITRPNMQNRQSAIWGVVTEALAHH